MAVAEGVSQLHAWPAEGLLPLQAWLEDYQVWKIHAYKPREEYRKGPAAVAAAQQQATRALDALGAKLLHFPALHAAQASQGEAAVRELLDRISRRPFDPQAEGQEFAALPRPLSAHDVWTVRACPALPAADISTICFSTVLRVTASNSHLSGRS